MKRLRKLGEQVLLFALVLGAAYSVSQVVGVGVHAGLDAWREYAGPPPAQSCGWGA